MRRSEIAITSSLMGASRHTTWVCTSSGRMTDVTPTIRPILARSDLITLPDARSGFPPNAAYELLRSVVRHPHADREECDMEREITLGDSTRLESR